MSANVFARSILVVDDDPDIRCVIEQTLLDLGVAVITAGDGIEALDALRQGVSPSLVLFDLMMPRMSGEELAQVIQERRLAVPLVSMSAGDRGLEPPLVREHVRKPFSLDTLEALVAAYCAPVLAPAEERARPVAA